eukprot:gene8819-biopygen4488
MVAWYSLKKQATINVSLVGRTGDGKSTFANLLYRLLGGDPNKAPFSESSSVNSHTHQPQSVLIQDLKITDHPGLVDSAGTFQDEKNIALIVNNMKEDKLVHAFLLVINEQSPRFDSACQSALKLMVDSFGPEILSVTGVVFTRSYSVSAADAQQYMTEELSPIITNVTGVDVSTMPFWQVDSHPEELWSDYPDRLSSTVARNERTVQEIRRWASTNHPVDVTKAFPSEYEIHIRIQEAKEEVVKLEKEREVAYERLRVAQEEFQKKQDETTRQIVEMEERHAKKLSDAIERARRGGGFWSGLLSVVVPVLTRVLL